ncbi:MAG TPA: DUF6152 family protein [Terriglobia bacterium]|nr:DUF6152 family protein [Terriglobia bacterium]
MKQVLLAMLALSAVVGSAYAHHSFAQYYFEDRSVTIEGEIVRFEYQSPHAWVYLDAKDEEGIARQYGAEWANPNRLTRDNITRDTLKVGDRVVVSGSPGKQPEEYKLHLKRIRRPADGWIWPPARR